MISSKGTDEFAKNGSGGIIALWNTVIPNVSPFSISLSNSSFQIGVEVFGFEDVCAIWTSSTWTDTYGSIDLTLLWANIAGFKSIASSTVSLTEPVNTMFAAKKLPSSKNDTEILLKSTGSSAFPTLFATPKQLIFHSAPVNDNNILMKSQRKRTRISRHSQSSREVSENYENVRGIISTIFGILRPSSARVRQFEIPLWRK